MMSHRTNGRHCLQLRVLMSMAAVAAQGPLIVGARVLTPDNRQYEMIEIGWQPEAVPANPFDSNVILVATILLPSGKQMVVPGFWFQDYERSLENPAVGA
jgi:hypothetical protein